MCCEHQTFPYVDTPDNYLVWDMTDTENFTVFYHEFPSWCPAYYWRNGGRGSGSAMGFSCIPLPLNMIAMDARNVL